MWLQLKTREMKQTMLNCAATLQTTGSVFHEHHTGMDCMPSADSRCPK